MIAAVLALLVAMAVPASAGADNSTLYWDREGTPAVGGGSHTTLDRGNVEVNAHIRNLPAGHAVTVWAVVFDAPTYCSAPGCGFDDLDNPSAEATIIYAAGGVTNAAGNLNVRNPIADSTPLFDIGDGELNNPDTAEIHFVIRSHGPHQPGSGDTTSFDGGCTGSGLDPGTVPMMLGDCADVQFSVHQA